VAAGVGVALGLFVNVACGGPAAMAAREPTVSPGPEPCPNPGHVRLGRICWNPAGSRWHVTANAPGGQYTFDVELLAANRLRATDHPAASPATDEWFVDGNTLRLFLANRFVEYRAELTNGTVMVGEAVNVRGDSWLWRGERVQQTTRCNRDEAELDGTCFALAGTRWTVRTGATEKVVHFDAGGQLYVDGSENTGTWSQQGREVRFTLDGREHSATVGDSVDELRGEGWTATRIELYPPPMH
jgi:hypothetical protein